MGFFKDFKDDFSQAVGELFPGNDFEDEETIQVNTLDNELDVEQELSKLDGLLEQVEKRVVARSGAMTKPLPEVEENPKPVPESKPEPAPESEIKADRDAKSGIQAEPELKPEEKQKPEPKEEQKPEPAKEEVAADEPELAPLVFDEPELKEIAAVSKTEPKQSPTESETVLEEAKSPKPADEKPEPTMSEPAVKKPEPTTQKPAEKMPESATPKPDNPIPKPTIPKEPVVKKSKPEPASGVSAEKPVEPAVKPDEKPVMPETLAEQLKPAPKPAAVSPKPVQRPVTVSPKPLQKPVAPLKPVQRPVTATRKPDERPAAQNAAGSSVRMPESLEPLPELPRRPERPAAWGNSLNQMKANRSVNIKEEKSMDTTVTATETPVVEIAAETAAISSEPMVASMEVTDEVSLITAGTNIKGNMETTGSFEIEGKIEGDIKCNGKLTVIGTVVGNSASSEFFADAAHIEGEVVSSGTVKIGLGSVIIGNISATSAVIAGAVKGDIDVQGPVVVDTSAVIMGNIKSRSVQINNGAVIEGFCSQCYSDVDVESLFNKN